MILTESNFFSQSCLNSIQCLGLFFSGKLIFPFFSPLGISDHTVGTDLKGKAGAKEGGSGERGGSAAGDRQNPKLL